MKKGEMALCNLKVRYKNKMIEIKDVIYKEVDGYYRRSRILKQYNIKDSEVLVVDKEILVSLGEESKSYNHEIH